MRALLPVGIKAVQGDFVRGDVVGCLAPDGTEIARGLVNYDSSQLRLIVGKHCENLLRFWVSPVPKKPCIATTWS